MAAICHPVSIAPPEAMLACCPSGTAPMKLEMHDLVGSTLGSAPSTVDMDGTELHNPSEVQTLTAFWKVEEGLHQVTDVQGHLKDQFLGKHT